MKLVNQKHLFKINEFILIPPLLAKSRKSHAGRVLNKDKTGVSAGSASE